MEAGEMPDEVTIKLDDLIELIDSAEEWTHQIERAYHGRDDQANERYGLHRVRNAITKARALVDAAEEPFNA